MCPLCRKQWCKDATLLDWSSDQRQTVQCFRLSYNIVSCNGIGKEKNNRASVKTSAVQINVSICVKEKCTISHRCQGQFLPVLAPEAVVFQTHSISRFGHQSQIVVSQLFAFIWPQNRSLIWTRYFPPHEKLFLKQEWFWLSFGQTMLFLQKLQCYWYCSFFREVSWQVMDPLTRFVRFVRSSGVYSSLLQTRSSALAALYIYLGHSTSSFSD